MSRKPTNTMPLDTSNKNGSSPSTNTKKEWHNFLIPDRTLRPEGFHLCSENYDLSMAQHAKILQMLSRIPKNNNSAFTDEKKSDEQQQQQEQQQQKQGGQKDHYHPFLHVDHSLRPEGLHLQEEQWNAQHQICH
jgi:hypothetical protein